VYAMRHIYAAIKLIANMIHSDSSACIACIRAYVVRHNAHNKAMVCTELNYTHCAFPNCSEQAHGKRVLYMPFAIPRCYDLSVMFRDSINGEKIRRKLLVMDAMG